MDPAAIAIIISAVIAVFTSVTAPLIIIRLGDRTRRLDREAEWARQDTLAARSATTQAEVLATARRASAAAHDNNRKLDQIHTLVNSNMTAAMTAEAAATERELAGMLEIIELRKALGQEPSPDALAAIESIRQRLAELQAQLADRARQTEIAERLMRDEDES